MMGEKLTCVANAFPPATWQATLIFCDVLPLRRIIIPRMDAKGHHRKPLARLVEFPCLMSSVLCPSTCWLVDRNDLRLPLVLGKGGHIKFGNLTFSRMMNMNHWISEKHTHIYININIYIYIHMCVCACVHIYIYMYMIIYACM